MIVASNPSAVHAFNMAAPALEETTIGGVTIEVFHDFWHGRQVVRDVIGPDPHPVRYYRCVLFRVKGGSWFVHCWPPGVIPCGLTASPTSPQLWTGKGSKAHHAAFEAWAEAMRVKYCS